MRCLERIAEQTSRRTDRQKINLSRSSIRSQLKWAINKSRLLLLINISLRERPDGSPGCSLSLSPSTVLEEELIIVVTTATMKPWKTIFFQRKGNIMLPEKYALSFPINNLCSDRDDIGPPNIQSSASSASSTSSCTTPLTATATTTPASKTVGKAPISVGTLMRRPAPPPPVNTAQGLSPPPLVATVTVTETASLPCTLTNGMACELIQNDVAHERPLKSGVTSKYLMIYGTVEIEALFGVKKLYTANQIFTAFGYESFDFNRQIKETS
ncbi:hypothetical protein TSMEX_011626 [Taenia solium]|eukprot:TsM_001169800 transcript=TsM_001169800 gene=TsM_001169800